MGVALVQARKRGPVAPGQSEHALRSGPWPRPLPPRAFSNLPELNTPEPARVGRGGVGGANGPIRVTPPLPDSPCADAPPTPAKNTSRPPPPPPSQFSGWGRPREQVPGWPRGELATASRRPHDQPAATQAVRASGREDRRTLVGPGSAAPQSPAAVARGRSQGGSRPWLPAVWS